MERNGDWSELLLLEQPHNCEYQNSPKTAGSGFKDQYRKFRLLLTFCILTLCLNVFVAMITFHTRKIGTTCLNASSSSITHSSYIPEFGSNIINFENDVEDYLIVSGQGSNQLWADRFWMNVPLGWGYHRIPNPRQYGLPISKAVPNSTRSEEIFLATFAHQLHCIGVLREALLSDEGRRSEYHIFHCLEKLRRGIICAGDTTPEAATLELTEEGLPHWSFDDWRQPHECRDWDSIKEWMDEHKI